MSYEELPAGSPPATARSGGESPAPGASRGSTGRKAVALEAPHKRRGEMSLGARIMDTVLLRFWRSMSWLLGHMSPRPAYFIGGWLMVAGYYLLPWRRRWIRANFAHVLGIPFDDPEAGRLTRRAFRHYAQYVVELWRLPWLPKERHPQLLDVDGLDRVKELYATSKGLVLVGGHIGNNEAGAAGFASNGLPVWVVGDDSAFGGLYDLLERQRGSWGVKMIAWRNLREVFGVLRRREVLALLIDWGYRADGIPVKFFDAWTTLPAGPAVLAARHGSTILPFSLQRVAEGRFRALPDEPITVASDDPAELARATQAIASALERAIRRAPDQWYIFKPIWPETAEEQARLETQAAEMLSGKAAGPGGARKTARADRTSPAAGAAGGASALGSFVEERGGAAVPPEPAVDG